jgi:hypothetical protein
MPDMPIDYMPFAKTAKTKKRRKKKARPQRTMQARPCEAVPCKPVPTAQQAAERALKYVHPYAVTALFMIALTLGFIGAWTVLGIPNTRGIGLLFCILLIWAAKFPIKVWTAWSAGRADNEKWIAEEIEKQLGQEEEAQQVRCAISEDYFDGASLSILKKVIKKARKERAKVSVPFLLKELASSIR